MPQRRGVAHRDRAALCFSGRYDFRNMTRYMVGTEIRAALIARPFKPFTIHMSDGRAFDVKDPETVMAPKDSEVIILYRGKSGYTMLNVSTIKTVVFDGPTRNSRRRRRKAG